MSLNVKDVSETDILQELHSFRDFHPIHLTYTSRKCPAHVISSSNYLA